MEVGLNSGSKSYSYVFRYEKPEHKISANLSNLFDDTWLPQKEIMGHPKLLAFITHGEVLMI